MATNSTVQVATKLEKDASRLLAPRIDLYARTEPDRPFVSVPQSTKPQDGFNDITYGEFARAVDRAANWLDSKLGKAEEQEAFTYFGPGDLRYLALIVAGAKSGRWMQITSPLLSADKTLQILDAAKCRNHLFAATPEAELCYSELQAHRSDIKHLVVPELSEWFAEGDRSEYSYNQTWEATIDAPVVGFHTSGTTGSPKPVIYRNSTIVYFNAQYNLVKGTPPLLMGNLARKRMFHGFSVHHMGGILFNLFYPVYFQSVPVFIPSKGPLTIEAVDETLRYGNVSIAVLSPAILEAMVRRPETFKTLQTLDWIGFGGAPLDKVTGDTLSKHTKMQTIYGSTEMTFALMCELAEPEDYAYFRFHKLAGFEFESRDDGLFELVVNRKEELMEFQPIFTTFPELSQFKTKDLFSQHPSKSDLWSYQGRTDDMITLSHGHKLHITRMEWILQEHPRVNAAIVGGNGRIRPFLLIELTSGHNKLESNESDASLDEVWSAVEKANEVTRAEGLKLSKRLTIIAPGDKPFPRLLKGSLDRPNTLKVYSQEIEDMYAAYNRELAIVSA